MMVTIPATTRRLAIALLLMALAAAPAWAEVRNLSQDWRFHAGEVKGAERSAFDDQAWQRVVDNYYTVVLGHSPGFYAISPKVHDLTIGFNTSAHRADGGIAFAWIEK